MSLRSTRRTSSKGSVPVIWLFCVNLNIRRRPTGERVGVCQPMGSRVTSVIHPQTTIRSRGSLTYHCVSFSSSNSSGGNEPVRLLSRNALRA
jgi:hypothetical protein